MHADFRTKEELEVKGAQASFQWASQWNGHNIVFQSDSDPILKLLAGMYAKVREFRFKISEDFGYNANNCINFKAQGFILKNRIDITQAVHIAIYCNRFGIIKYWTRENLRTLLNNLKIQFWNETVINSLPRFNEAGEVLLNE